MKTIIAIMSCTVMAFVTSAFDNPNDKWAARRAIQNAQHANMAAFNNTMGNMAMQAMIARMAQGGGAFGVNPQVQIANQVGALGPMSRSLLIALIYERIKALINMGNLVEADRVFGLAKLALQNFDHQFTQHAAEIASMYQAAQQRMMFGGF